MITDVTLGFNETLLFDVRYHELRGIADQFVIIEATHTHSGNPKPLYFTEWLKENPRDDVIVQVWDNGPSFAPTTPQYAWHRENTHREVIRLYLLDNYSPDDLILFSDMDEIPSGNVVAHLWSESHSGIKILEQDLFYLYLNTYAGKWCGTRAFYLRDIPETMHRVRYLPVEESAGKIENSGWHFSSLAVNGVETVKRKLGSFAHVELSDMPLESIQDSLDRAVDPFHKQPLQKYPMSGLPWYVRYNQHLFAGLIYEYETS